MTRHYFTVGAWCYRGPHVRPTMGAQYITSLPLDRHDFFAFSERGMCWNFDWDKFLMDVIVISNNLRSDYGD